MVSERYNCLRRLLLLIVPIPDTVYRLDDAGIGRVGFYAFAELGNVLVEGAAGRVVVGAPALVEEGVAVQGSTPVVVEEFKDGDVAEGEFDDEVITIGPEFGGDDFEGVELEAVVLGGGRIEVWRRGLGG